MAIFSDLSILSVVYNSGTLSVVGIAFSENQYSGKVQFSLDGLTWGDPASYTSWGDSEIVCETGTIASGVYQLRVINGDNETSEIELDAFIVTSPIVVSSAQYTTSTKAIDITGTGFLSSQGTGKVELSKDGGAWVEVDTYSTWGDTSISCVVSSLLPAGVYSVRVTNSYALADTLTDAFIAAPLVAPPIITSVYPITGRIGDSVNIYGVFPDASLTAVTIDGIPAIVTAYDISVLRVVLPTHAVGLVGITATDSAAQSDTMINALRYVEAPDCILMAAVSGMETLIQSMRIYDGFNFDWGECNSEDLAHATFPHAIIDPVEEECLDETDGAWALAYRNKLIFKIKIRQEASTEDINPKYGIRELFFLALDDLKKLFGNNCTLAGEVECMIYKGSNFDMTRIGNNDIFIPYEMLTNWQVEYSQSRINPAEHA